MIKGKQKKQLKQLYANLHNGTITDENAGKNFDDGNINRLVIFSNIFRLIDEGTDTVVSKIAFHLEVEQQNGLSLNMLFKVNNNLILKTCCKPSEKLIIERLKQENFINEDGLLLLCVTKQKILELEKPIPKQTIEGGSEKLVFYEEQQVCDNMLEM